VTANSLHPGVVYTEILTKEGNKVHNFIMKILFLLFGKDEKLGAQTSVYLAVSDDVENISGEYFIDCK
ncbi:hypothetical protein SK128_014736, partial [Halocaridina rubra]